MFQTRQKELNLNIQVLKMMKPSATKCLKYDSDYHQDT